MVVTDLSHSETEAISVLDILECEKGTYVRPENELSHFVDVGTREQAHVHHGGNLACRYV